MDSEEDKFPPTWVIVVVTLGAVTLLAVVAILVYFIFFRKPADTFLTPVRSDIKVSDYDVSAGMNRNQRDIVLANMIMRGQVQ